MGAANSNEITRAYYDKILVKTRYIDSDLPDMSVELFGKKFSTPIATAALSHLNGTHEKGMVELAKGAKLANALNFCGMESYDGELDDIMTAGADSVKFIKPHANNDDIFSRIEHAKELGVFGLGMDIDHAYTNDGGYDNVMGLPMKPKSMKELESFVKAAGDLPFIIKGVLSVEDAKKCVEIGAKGIVVSHHHGIMPYSVAPAMVLPEIAEAVGGKLTIFADCGIESGMDCYKALALGADAICLGRSLMGPLKEEGAEGVAKKIAGMTNELASVMARTGFKNVASIDSRCLMINY
ncbi:MAG: alpha-hydroxy-acid oxidizing protein [Lachnospiraceae bacterium]|nr:alpha-hydroxy-acid oxidizing protein [Lachnospiraceae bacterium]